MTPPQTTTPDSANFQSTNGTFSADVVAFAAAHQAEHCLRPLLEATQRIFPTANFIKIYVEEDPELRDNTQIVFHVQMNTCWLDQSGEKRGQWHEALANVYRPTSKLPFCLRLEHNS